MKTRLFLIILIAGCLQFEAAAAQVVVTRRPLIYHPRRVVVVKPTPVLLPSRRVVIVQPAPLVRVAPLRAHRRVLIY